MNTVTVSGKENLLSRTMVVKELNWAGGKPPSKSFRCLTKIRYRNPGVFSVVNIYHDGAEVSFDEPQSAVTPGQSAVFYKGDTVLGGGIIEK
jgi:tRNA-specific 2-thiouridylase